MDSLGRHGNLYLTNSSLLLFCNQLGDGLPDEACIVQQIQKVAKLQVNDVLCDDAINVSGPAAYAYVKAFTTSIIGKLFLFGYTWALLHHLCSGIRYFFWDLGYGFKPNEREALTWGALIAGISLTVLVWIIAYATIGGGR